jgi:8-oxo-dGTP pyrophosphatase MutT (NUDIX family)
VLLFLKADVKGYTRKDGVRVAPYTTKVIKKVTPVNAQSSLFGGALVAKAHYPDAVTHPQKNDEGHPVQINEPSSPSPVSTWTAPTKTAVFVPGGAVPDALNGVPIVPWADHPKTNEGWEYVEGQMPDLDEPDMVTGGKAPAAGVVIEEPDGRIWLVSPSNGFAGYMTTFPKGHADDGLSLQATAIKEAFEESGLKVKITGLLGDVERGNTVTRYYRAQRVGGTPAAMGWETQAVQLVPKQQVHAAVNRKPDRAVATLAGIAAPPSLIEAADDWQKIGKQAGTNPGGVYRDDDGSSWYVKLPKSADIAKNEVLAAQLYAAAGVRVPDLKHVTVGGKLAIASGMIAGMTKLPKDPASVRGVMDGFAVDAWLANWDVVGLEHDNLLADPDGAAVRVDVGGSLLYRAQGQPKGAAFGSKVGELDTLTNGKNLQSASVFGGITHADLVAGIRKVASVSGEMIKRLCHEYGPGTAAQRTKLANTLLERQAYLAGLLKSA